MLGVNSGMTANFKRPLNQMHAPKGFSRNFLVKSRRIRDFGAAAYKVSPWPRFREITPKSLHDDHTTRFAW